MSVLTAPEVRTFARSEVNGIDIDWGENTAGSETGTLKAGDTVSSCVVAVESKPSGAADPTFGSVSANGSDLVVNDRTCSAGEATSVQVTMASDQAYGEYKLKFTATTANGYTIPRWVRCKVEPC
mgnify:CR=1 FL=1